ncbi:membrane protein [Pseudoxanthomonas sangjuensis]|uniref:MMPL family transporter n=1 Tax=Pseudoxanthomonas sangjuensis TaxID=1503750 RepID=UPI003CCE5139
MTDSPASDGKPERGWRWLALAWLLAVAAVGWHQWRFWHAPRIDSDVLALLPQEAGERELSEVARRIADASARQMVVLLGAPAPEQAQRAEAAFVAELQRLREADATAVPFAANGSARDWFAQAQAFYAPYRDRLLTDAQRETLQRESTDALAEQALAALYGPIGAPRLTAWQADPLNLWPQWWQQRAAGSGLRMGEDGLLQGEGHYWAVLQFGTQASAFRLDGTRRIADALDAATAAARGEVPGLRELRAGVPLHAEAAAAQANREINTIGWGSLAAVLLLVWLAFRSLRPIVLVAASLLIGVATALSATVVVFGKVHLLTLIFGASLVGVAEDYGIHWFASRQGQAADARWKLLRHLLPGLWLALATSAAAYLALGLAPFPGLRQMALFSVVGLAAAFLTVVCWFPWLDRGELRATRFSRWLGATLRRWPRALANGKWWVAAAFFAFVVAGGLWRLQSDDDLRSLQSSPRALLEQQAGIGKLMGLPSPAQFYLVRGADAEQTLRREEALLERLRGLEHQRRIAGHRALSDWIPSRKRQAEDAALSARIENEVLAKVGAALGETPRRGEFSTRPLELRAVLDSPVSQPFRQLWLGRLGDGVATVVMIDGLSKEAVGAMPAQAEGLPGVRWVDRTADFSRLLRHYRRLMTGLLGVGAALVFALLYWRYRRDAWRVLLPTLLAGLLAVALLGWLGLPLQLFNVLALLLLLGMGIDYGIFLLEHRGDAGAWMAVCVGAASTWLSFGLLGLSATPALRAFGLTLLFGIGAVWLLSPLFRPGQAAHPQSENQGSTR